MVMFQTVPIGFAFGTVILVPEVLVKGRNIDKATLREIVVICSCCERDRIVVGPGS